MADNFTQRARRYVVTSPQTKKLPEFAKDRLVKGIARLMKTAYSDGLKENFKKTKGI